MFVYTIDDIIWLIGVGILGIIFIILMLWAVIDKITSWIEKRVNRRNKR